MGIEEEKTRGRNLTFIVKMIKKRSGTTFREDMLPLIMSKCVTFGHD